MFTETPDDATAWARNLVDPADATPGKPVMPRTWTMRVARAARHLQGISTFANQCDTLLSALLFMKRPRWVNRGIIGLRAAEAATKLLDERVNAEVRRAGFPCWPCYEILVAVMAPYYVGTYFANVHWYRVPLRGKMIDVVLSAVNRHTLYIVGADEDRAALVDLAWQSWTPVAEVHPDPFDVRAGAPLMSGFSHPLAARLDADLGSGVRKAVFLLGSPGTGKSHVAEQTAGLVAARGKDRVLRLPDAAGCKTQTIVALVEMMRPDVVVIHDVDTDALKSPVLLRFAEALVRLGVVFICTANSRDGMHAAAFGDHRLGAPVVMETADVGVLLEVLGRPARDLVDAWVEPSSYRASRSWVWPAVFALPLMRVDTLRRYLEAGRDVSTALEAVGVAAPVTAPTCASPAAAT